MWKLIISYDNMTLTMIKISTPKKESRNVFSSSKNEAFKLSNYDYEELWRWVTTSNGDRILLLPKHIWVHEL
jgi:hypothetical protein